MRADSTWMADVRILARETNGSGIAMYHRRFLSQRVGNTSEIIGSIQTIGTDYESDSAWDVAISIPDASDHLQIDVSGSPTSTVKWIAEVSLLEIGGYLT